jgi:rubredoxin-NAD+ reductase
MLHPIGEAAFRQYLCRYCGYVYDEAAGDRDGGIAAGTRYVDLPEDWICPQCGATKGGLDLVE